MTSLEVFSFNYAIRIYHFNNEWPDAKRIYCFNNEHNFLQSFLELIGVQIIHLNNCNPFIRWSWYFPMIKILNQQRNNITILFKKIPKWIWIDSLLHAWISLQWSLLTTSWYIPRMRSMLIFEDEEGKSYMENLASRNSN